MLKGKNIIVGVTGGIAAYKVPFIVRELKLEGADVQCVMTESAKEFTTPLTLSTLAGHETVVGAYPEHDTKLVKSGTWHIDLGAWANAMLIAPATANTIAKLASGYADNAVTMLALALRCPLIVCPAMDADMWEHRATQSNVAQLRELGCTVLPPDEGKLASGLTGPGRLPEIVAIVRAVERVVDGAHRDLNNRSILISAGPTHEPIDPVRFLGNRSSGKMGFALANAAAIRGADVTLVAGPTHLGTPRFVRRIDVETAAEMSGVIKEEFIHADALIMAAAVADFTPVKSKDKKIRKEDMSAGAWDLKLEPTEDILKSLSHIKDKKVKVGFALETGGGTKNAQRKLKEKKLDLIVLNDLRDEGAGFGVDTNVVTIFSKSGKKEKLPKMAKFDVANAILDRLKRLLPK